MLGHDTGAPSEQHPRKQAADQRIADADPGGSDAEVPAELARVADEYNRGEVRGTVGERGNPRADIASTENKVPDAGGIFAAVEADKDGYGKKEQDHQDLFKHGGTSFWLGGQKNRPPENGSRGRENPCYHLGSRQLRSLPPQQVRAKTADTPAR